MGTFHQRLAWSVVALVALAGCAAAESAATATTTSVAPAPPPTVTADTASITGTVVDDEARPVVEAEIVVSGPMEAGTRSDGSGRFTLNDLLPGSYVLGAHRLGYDSIAKRVEALAGEPTTVNILLVPLVIDGDPRHETRRHEGFIPGPNFYSPALIVYNTYNVPVNLTTGARDIVLSMKWDVNGPTLSRFMRERITHSSNTAVTHGPSPLTTKIVDLEMKKAKETATAYYNMYFACPTISAQCYTDNPESLIPVVVYQQRVSLFATVFFSMSAPEGFTGLP